MSHASAAGLGAGPDVFADRLAGLAHAARDHGFDAVLVSPGADLSYFLGHSVGSFERLTCLVVNADGTVRLLVPTLERLGWSGSPAEQVGIEISTWTDGADAYAALAELVGGARRLGLDEHLPVGHALRIRDEIAGSSIALAGDAIGELRMRKSAAEVEQLAAAGAAIDRVQQRIGEWLRPGRTEDEVAADIGRAIVEEGHSRADFVIVGSGPNGGSPHHEASDRVIEPGELVVIDIGGPVPTGYFSDCTRTYRTAGELQDPEADVVYDVVQRAQAAGVAAARAGVQCQAVDRAARSVIEEAGYGEFFITRTGHGIGLEVHELPYLVAGNDRELEPGMAFSVEPGIYLPGRFGVRIEDIVVVGADGPILMNRAPRELLVVGG